MPANLAYATSLISDLPDFQRNMKRAAFAARFLLVNGNFARPRFLPDIVRNEALGGRNIVTPFEVGHRKIVLPMKHFILVAEVDTEQAWIVRVYGDGNSGIDQASDWVVAR